MQVTEHELARHSHSRMTEKVRVPVGGAGVEEGRRREGEEEGKIGLWSGTGVGTACRGSVWRDVSASLAFIASRESNSEAHIRIVHRLSPFWPKAFRI